LLVCGRTVGAGYGDVEQAQVDRKLAAVMDQVAQGEVPEHGHPGPFEPQPAHYFEAPSLHQGRIGNARQGMLAVGDIVVARLEQVGH